MGQEDQRRNISEDSSLKYCEVTKDKADIL